MRFNLRKTWASLPLGALVILAALALAGPVSLAAAQHTDVFQVNETSQGSQFSPSVSANSDGRFVICWESATPSGTKIMTRIYDGGGNPGTHEFLAQEEAGQILTNPRVASLGGGGYVVVWEAQDAIWFRRFDNLGYSVSDKNLVYQESDPTNHITGHARVSGLTNGGFVVVWEEYNGFHFNCFGRTFDGSGNAVTDKFLLNGGIDGNQTRPQVSNTYPDGFAVVWRSDNPTDNGTFGICARTFYDSGVPRSGDIQVIPDTGDLRLFARYPNVLGVPGGSFMVMHRRRYCSEASCAQYNERVFGRFYDLAGQPRTDDFPISEDKYSYTALGPVASVPPSGHILVVWPQIEAPQRYVLLSQSINTSGGREGGVILINGDGSSRAEVPAVAPNRDSRQLITWRSWFLDGDQFGVHARIY